MAGVSARAPDPGLAIYPQLENLTFNNSGLHVDYRHTSKREKRSEAALVRTKLAD